MKRIHQTTFLLPACGLAAALWLLAASSPRGLGDEPAPTPTGAPTTTATVTDEADATATVTDEVQQGALEVQRALGGSIVDQFPLFQGVTPQGASPPAFSRAPWWKQFTGSLEIAVTAPRWGGPPVTAAQPGHWPNWTAQPPTATFIVPATAELQSDNPSPRPVAALRATALELDASANRLEELDLYSQADALRELAQQLRLDARKRATNANSPADSAPSIDPATSWIEPSPAAEPPSGGMQFRDAWGRTLRPAEGFQAKPAPRRKTPARLLQNEAPGEPASGDASGQNE